MNRDEIKEQVKKVFYKTFMCDKEFSEDLSPTDVDDWESMKNILFLSNLEKEFQIKFKFKDLLVLNTIEKVINEIEALLK